MNDIMITVRPDDWKTLESEAEREWREPVKQASAMLEAALRAAATRTARGGRSAKARAQRTNGTARIHVGSIDSD